MKRSLRHFKCMLGSFVITLGAPVHADENMIINVPHSAGVLSEPIGIETLGGIFTVWIDAGTDLPTSRRQDFGAAAADQVDIKVFFFHGDDDLVVDNTFMNRLVVTGFQDTTSEGSSVTIEVSIDELGMVSFDASQLGSPLNVAVDKSPRPPSPFTIEQQP